MILVFKINRLSKLPKIKKFLKKLDLVSQLFRTTVIDFKHKINSWILIKNKLKNIRLSKLIIDFFRPFFSNPIFWLKFYYRSIKYSWKKYDPRPKLRWNEAKSCPLADIWLVNWYPAWRGSQFLSIFVQAYNLIPVHTTWMKWVISINFQVWIRKRM